MPAADLLLRLEEQFWTSDADFYQANLTPDALMVFADPAGAMTKQAIVQSIRDAPRWRQVELEDVTHVELMPDVVLLVYRATAEREAGEGTYVARCSSVYVRRGDDWQLAFHQQTPVP